MRVKKTTPYSVLLLETGKRSLEMQALKRTYTCIMKVKLMETTRLSRIACSRVCPSCFERHTVTGSKFTDVNGPERGFSFVIRNFFISRDVSPLAKPL